MFDILITDQASKVDACQIGDFFEVLRIDRGVVRGTFDELLGGLPMQDLGSYARDPDDDRRLGFQLGGLDGRLY
ncbi:hypothetical protein PGTUg99_015447 [Puccinia graminis f. sp. tritici]|uniref:Uncharacterized protein n=1 Tax=Puccinia graminis f. sp. tritici TaxID=56615 RepID=A0A5B0RQD8_PUCGR|nr:hypothetical protein PGTUg99_015447 [Puccinia graminis f. sp. tritici]